MIPGMRRSWSIETRDAAVIDEPYLRDVIHMEASVRLGNCCSEFMVRAKDRLRGDLADCGLSWLYREWVIWWYATGIIEDFFFSREADQIRNQQRYADSVSANPEVQHAGG